jgi:SAM-dependent methyltransferase
MNDQEIKTCCATFYQSDLLRLLLGDILHPGGLELTGRLGGLLGLSDRDRVLDIACGRGASAVYLARRFGSHLTGLDFGAANIAAAEKYASAEGMSHLTAFQQGDAEGLPFKEGTFDVIISECSFCTFPDKTKAAREMARVLRPGGRLGITDMTIGGQLPEDIQSLLSWVACVAGAGTPEFYLSELKKAGFTDFLMEDHRDALLEMVKGVRHKMLGVELAMSLGKLELGGLDIGNAKHIGQRTLELIEKGLIGYTLITAKRD